MRATFLGHASWLFEAGPLRILSDPLVFSRHAGGVLSVTPERTLDVAALRPDFILVTHAHFDHFDIDSLDALARFDRDSGILTPDELVASCCETLGFRSVRVVPAGQRIELAGGVKLITTPSRAPDVEWGFIVSDGSAAAWNMVDSCFESAREVRQIVREAGLALDVCIAPLQPMREVAMAMSEHTGFDPSGYHHLFECARAAGAKSVIPGASGESFNPPFDGMNRIVYPVSRERAARDYAAFAPESSVILPALFEVLAIADREVVRDRAAPAPGVLLAEREQQPFRPWDVPPLHDPNLDCRPSEELVETIEAWLHGALEPALANHVGLLGGLSLMLEVVLEDGVVHFTCRVPGPFERRCDPGCDELVAIAGSLLADVLEARRSWAEPLLGGFLRATGRTVRVSEGVMRFPPIPPIFLYFALDFRASVEATAREQARDKASLPDVHSLV